MDQVDATRRYQDMLDKAGPVSRFVDTSRLDLTAYVTDRALDGLYTVDDLHDDTHRRLRKLLGRSDFIYVADCKLATADNLRKIVSREGRFISVMPRTWREDKEFRKLVRLGQVTWRHLLARKNNRKPGSKVDHYFLAAGEYRTAAGYALLWIKSTQKAEQDAETRTRQLEKALDELRTLQGRLNAYKLKTRTAIREAAATIVKSNQCQKFIAFRIHSHRDSMLRYKKRGRPGLSNPAIRTYAVYYALSFEVNREEVATAQLTDGVFPLITNVHKDHSARQILETYKFQPFLEKRHSQIKTYQQVAPAFVKKGERAVALLHLHVMALTVATLIERQLRQAMKAEGIDALPIYPGALPCKYPTMFDIARLFDDVERYEVHDGDSALSFPANLAKTQLQVLKMLDVPQALYH
jgi:transposase